jgi:hypothetical protein
VLLGPEAPGLSVSTIGRLEEFWQRDFEVLSKRLLADKRHVYFWVDGMHFNTRLEEERECLWSAQYQHSVLSLAACHVNQLSLPERLLVA